MPSEAFALGVINTHHLVFAKPGQQLSIPPILITSLFDIFTDLIANCFRQSAKSVAQIEAEFVSEIRAGSKKARRWARKAINREPKYKHLPKWERKLLADEYAAQLQVADQSVLQEVLDAGKQKARA